MPIPQKLIAPRRGATVVIFEPRQSPDAPEHIYETFEMKGYEEREFEMPTGTAAYRFEPLFARDHDPLDGEKFIPPAQEPRESTPDFSEEIDAGRKTAKQHASTAKKAGLPTSAEEEEKTREKRAAKKRAAAKKSTKKASSKKSSRKGTKKRNGPPAAPEENEAEQIANATNPMTNPDPDMRGTTGKKPGENDTDAAGRKAGDDQSGRRAERRQERREG